MTVISGALGNLFVTVDTSGPFSSVLSAFLELNKVKCESTRLGGAETERAPLCKTPPPDSSTIEVQPDYFRRQQAQQVLIKIRDREKLNRRAD